MHLAIGQVRQSLTATAQQFVTAAEAVYFADLLIEGHLRKAPRMNVVQEAVADLEVWAAASEREIESEVDRESVLLLDFKRLAPSLKIKYMHDEIEQRARKNGMAAVGFRNSSGIITLSPWVEGLARRDLLGIMLFDGGTGCTVPFAGTRGVFGTLPLAYAVPSLDHPIMLDMAMSEIPFFQVKKAKERGEQLPVGAAVDARGLPTVDAAAALGDDGVANLLPIGGGFKGYGLVMLIEILTGALVRGLLSTAQTRGWNPPELGGLVCAIDVASFTDPERFKREISEMCAELRRQTPAEGMSEVAIPGDRGHRNACAGRAAGFIELDDNLVARLEQLAG
jgi:LDH2 family malate/lactate/ureidoglycolate dehydrogenase